MVAALSRRDAVFDQKGHSCLVFDIVEVVDLVWVGDLDLARRDVVRRRMRNVYRHVHRQRVLVGNSKRLG